MFCANEKIRACFLQDVDGRSDTGKIFVRRGSAARKRPPKMSPAPLAKQESFSDLVCDTLTLCSIQGSRRMCGSFIIKADNSTII